MEVEEISDSVKKYFDDKLKNPYFASVIAVWIITNRVLFFGIFNFDKNTTLQEKVDWIHLHFESFTKLDWFFEFKGFYATIVWSFLWGYVTVVVFNWVNGSGKIVYKLAARLSNKILAKIEPDKWKPTKDFNELLAKVDSLEEEVSRRKVDYKALEKSSDDLKSSDLLNKQNADKFKTSLEEVSLNLQLRTAELEEKDKQITQYQNTIQESKKLKVSYARYGKNERYFDVTEKVTAFINNKQSFSVTNYELANGEDPAQWFIKELFIVYESNNQSKILRALEGETITWTDNELSNSSTEGSIKSAMQLSNLKEIKELFKGEWTLTYSKNGNVSTERFFIDEYGRYFIKGEHRYTIMGIAIHEKGTLGSFDGDILFSKINLDNNLHSRENLHKTSNNIIEGTDNLGYKLKYEKQS